MTQIKGDQMSCGYPPEGAGLRLIVHSSLHYNGNTYAALYLHYYYHKLNTFSNIARNI